MSHIVKSEKGQNVVTWCGRNIPKAAAGVAKSRSRRRRQHEKPRAKKRTPFFYLNTDASNKDFGVTLEALHGVCHQCLDALPPGLKETWIVRASKYLRNMEEIHIADKRVGDGVSVQMMCGKTWEVSTLFRNMVGYIDLKDLKDYAQSIQLCDECSDHPLAQLQLLAVVDLGEL